MMISEDSDFHPTGRLAAKKPVKPVNFTCWAADAKKVTLAGDFNDWNIESIPMKKQVDGAWTAQVLLAQGHHQYIFVVDGQPTLDPRAQGTVKNDVTELASLIAVS